VEELVERVGEPGQEKVKAEMMAKWQRTERESMADRHGNNTIKPQATGLVVKQLLATGKLGIKRDQC
jgi:hypothetical protein